MMTIRPVLVLVGLLGAVHGGDTVNQELVVTNCERSIDISSQLVKM